MSLTTKDILERTFKRSFKGYDEDEVDKFLDEIIDELKALKNENETLKKEINSVKELESNIRSTEETIMNTLVSAQKSSERILREAARKAELLIDNAENTARQRAQQTKIDLAEMESKLAAIKKSAGNFAMSFSEMINAQAVSFEKTYLSYFGDMDAYSSSGINIQALEKLDKSISKDIEEIVSGADKTKSSEINDALKLKADWTVPYDGSSEFPGNDEEYKNDAEHLKPLTKDDFEPEAEELYDAVTEKVELSKADDVLEPFSHEDDSIPLNEINKVLSEIEEAPDDEAANGTKYDDYSWLYDEDKTNGSEFELSFKDPEESKKLKNLIDEVLE